MLCGQEKATLPTMQGAPRRLQLLCRVKVHTGPEDCRGLEHAGDVKAMGGDTLDGGYCQGCTDGWAGYIAKAQGGTVALTRR